MDNNKVQRDSKRSEKGGVNRCQLGASDPRQLLSGLVL